MKKVTTSLALIGTLAIVLAPGCKSKSKSASVDHINNLLLATGPKPSSSQSLPSPKADSSAGFSFTFNAFGDAGWAKTHVSRPQYNGGFKTAFSNFDPTKELIADINYINWETTVGTQCDQFWAPSTAATYAFLSHPNDLSDAVNLGFNLIGLANNHTFDCIRSPEGIGPLQTYRHIQAIGSQLSQEPSRKQALFSGVFQSTTEEPRVGEIELEGKGSIPISFISAYVGGDAQHCRNMLCDLSLSQYSQKLASQPGLRVLALHSWNSTSHARLKAVLRDWLQRGLVDVAIGSGPHVAESVDIVQTPKGPRVMATSLGNFIHPSLSAQPNNIVLRTQWRYDSSQKILQLEAVKGTVASCVGESCRKGATRDYPIPLTR